MIAIAAFLISLLGLGGLLRWRQGRDEGSTAPTSPPASTSVDSESGSSPGESLLESATTLQAGGELKSAIEVGYAAGRHALVSRYGLDERGTHREFQARASQQSPSDIQDTLATLTDAYERSTYGPGDTSEAEVTEVLTMAEELVSKAS